jgi:DNA-binding NarL/FixJ family response regulator
MFKTTHENLSKREMEVLMLIEAGLTNRQIAQRIIVETGTVKRHVHNILGKLNARNRVEAVARVRETQVSQPHLPELRPIRYSALPSSIGYTDQLWW